MACLVTRVMKLKRLGTTITSQIFSACQRNPQCRAFYLNAYSSIYRRWITKIKGLLACLIMSKIYLHVILYLLEAVSLLHFHSLKHKCEKRPSSVQTASPTKELISTNFHSNCLNHSYRNVQRSSNDLKENFLRSLILHL